MSHCRYQQLSGGEQQRVQLARVLVQARAIVFYTGHAYMLLDEPTSSLDPGHQQRMMKLLQTFSQREQVGILTIMHDINLAARWCDRVILLKAGKILAEGPPVRAFTDQLLEQAFDIPLQVIAHPKLADRVLVLTAG
jgi:iron complex transport system ATP-binding protein